MDSTTPDLYISRASSTLRQRVTDRLRNAVLDGTFHPGQKLVERDLCEMMGVSRTVLRESLQRLGAEGLVTMVPHKGPIVATITLAEARDIYAVRRALEALAGEGFARNASAAQIRQIKATLGKLRKVSGTVDSHHRVLDIKNEFYEILLKGCGNAVVGTMLTILNNRVTILRRTSLATPGRLPRTIAEMEEVVAAIEKRDAELAGRLCAEHVGKAAEAVFSYLASADQNSPSTHEATD
ncbi:DNA-binding GntR family transcriptional regulator OS=Castellaniella defragrans OX=75697 GN=HNR28_002002 PE=4 SV=1 [Castellaniella defragrans]